MLNKSRILYLTRDQFWLHHPHTGKLSAITHQGDYLSVFKHLKNTFHSSSLKLIFGECVSYTLCLVVKSDQTNRKHLQATLSTLIPEALTSANFDWQSLGGRDHAGYQLIQTVALSHDLLFALSSAASQARLKLEFFFAPLILAGLTKKIIQPHLILFHGPESFAAVSYRGAVYYSENFDPLKLSDLNPLFQLAQNKFKLTLTKVITNWKEIDKTITFPRQCTIEKVNFKLMATVAKKKIKKGQDKTVLEIKPVEVPEQPQPAEHLIPEKPAELSQSEESTPAEEPQTASELAPLSEEPSTSGSRKKLLIVIIFLLLSLGLVFAVYFLAQHGYLTRATQTVPSPEAQASPAPTPAPEGLRINQYSIQVLNGSGLPGRAATIAEALTSAGFNSPETGNAASYSQQQTEIRLKADVPLEIIKEIAKALGADYDPVYSPQELSSDFEFDILITAGKS